MCRLVCIASDHCQENPQCVDWMSRSKTWMKIQDVFVSIIPCVWSSGHMFKVKVTKRSMFWKCPTQGLPNSHLLMQCCHWWPHPLKLMITERFWCAINCYFTYNENAKEKQIHVLTSVYISFQTKENTLMKWYYVGREAWQCTTTIWCKGTEMKTHHFWYKRVFI